MDTAFKRTSAASAAAAASSTTSAAKGNIIEPILIVGLSPPSENNNTITGIVSSQQMSSICISSGSSLNEFSNSDSSSSSDEVLVDEMPSKDLLPAGTRTRTRTLSNSKGEDDVITTETGRKVYTKGRPPWYDRDGKRQKKSYLIGICGGSASGKTTVAKKIISRLEMPWVTVLSMDSFYKVLNEEQHLLAAKHEYNFDHPDAFDFDLMYESLLRLKDGKSVEVPVYDFTTHRRAKNPKLMYGADILIFEGILSFHKPEIADLMDMKVFVDTDSDTRLVRRLERDIAERGRDVAGVLEQYIKYVKPAFDSFIAPAMKIADIIVPRGGENVVAIDLIVRQIKNQLTERGYYASAANGISNNSHPQQQLAAATIDSSSGPCPRMWPPSLHILRECAQVRGLHASIRSRKTTRAEFMGFCERLMPKLIEQAVKFMPMPTHRQQQNGGHPKGDAVKGICGVSIMRAGESLENSLRSVIKNCKLGKILIVSNERTLEPELYYLRLPKNISQYKILLMDATVATGASAIMAIRILLDHDVREEGIVLLSLLMAEAGVHSLAYTFPRVTLLTTAVQSKINEHLNANWKAENFEEFLAFGNEAVELATDDEDNAGDNDEIVTAAVDGQK